MIKPIETVYNGYRFRSRLEARWAVLFDALGIKYEYEPEGYEFPNGKKYLPDFVLHGGEERCPDPLYVEVKGQMTMDDAEKIRAFAGMCPKYKYVLTCESCEHCHDQNCGYGVEISWNGDGSVGLYPDYQYYGSECHGMPIYIVTNIPADIEDICNGIDIEGLGVPYYNFLTVDGDYFGAVLGAQKDGGWGLFGADSNYWARMDKTTTRAAYAKARQARFEHGELPTPNDSRMTAEDFKKWLEWRSKKWINI